MGMSIWNGRDHTRQQHLQNLLRHCAYSLAIRDVLHNSELLPSLHIIQWLSGDRVRTLNGDVLNPVRDLYNQQYDSCLPSNQHK
jgi:hypothetical protein